MNLDEAVQSAEQGNFISHQGFDKTESMHVFNNSLYYEDGANLTVNNTLGFIGQQDWAKDGWYVKYPKEKVDKEKLKQLHENNKGCMIGTNSSYEDCIIR